MMATPTAKRGDIRLHQCRACINSAFIDPDPASTLNDLSVVVDVTDAEDDAIEGYAYEWFINGSAGTDATWQQVQPFETMLSLSL